MSPGEDGLTVGYGFTHTLRQRERLTHLLPEVLLIGARFHLYDKL